MLVWPSVAVFGFLTLVVLVIALAASSTARYEFGRNSARQPELAMAAAPTAGQMAAVTSAGGTTAGGGIPPAEFAPPAFASAEGGLTPADGGAAPGTQPSVLREQQMAVSRAAHPAGKLAGGGGATAGWWLVCPIDDEPGAAAEIVAGPFPDRLEADWAALSGGLEAVAVYGARGAGQRLVLRPAPQDRAWLGALSEQLDRLAGDWDELLTDDDELTTLVVEIAAALVEAGMELHDCDGQDAAGGGAGGVCLTPEPASNGILVSWRPHDRMSVEQVRGGYLDAAVQEAMNAALAEVLAVLGFAVEPFGATGCHLVTADER